MIALIGGVLGALFLAGPIFWLGACGPPPAEWQEMDDKRHEGRYIALIMDARQR